MLAGSVDPPTYCRTAPHRPAPTKAGRLGTLLILVLAQTVLGELTAIYAKYDPTKLGLPGFLDALMRSYEGREAQLLKQVCRCRTHKRARASMHHPLLCWTVRTHVACGSSFQRDVSVDSRRCAASTRRRAHWSNSRGNPWLRRTGRRFWPLHTS